MSRSSNLLVLPAWFRRRYSQLLIAKNQAPTARFAMCLSVDLVFATAESSLIASANSCRYRKCRGPMAFCRFAGGSISLSALAASEMRGWYLFEPSWR